MLRLLRRVTDIAELRPSRPSLQMYLPTSFYHLYSRTTFEPRQAAF